MNRAVTAPMTPERLAEIRGLQVDSLSADAEYNADVWALEQARLDLLAECDRLRAQSWLNTLSYAATALEASADNGDRYAARQIRDYLAALASGDEVQP